MTELNGAASEQSGNAAAANTAANSGSEAAPGAAAVQDWVAALDEDNRKSIDAKGWSKLQGGDREKAIFTAYAELEKKSGQAFHLPKADAPEAEKLTALQTFYDAMGRPKTAAEIAFELPKEMPEGLVYDEAFANEIKPLFHEAGVFGASAQKLHDAYLGHQARLVEAQADAIAQRESAATEALNKAWGAPETEQHKANLAFVNRAIREAGGETILAELKSYGVLGADGAVRAPGLATMLATLAERAFADPTVPGGGTPTPERPKGLYPNLP